jgi:hypothetical protein
MKSLGLDLYEVHIGNGKEVDDETFWKNRGT